MLYLSRKTPTDSTVTNKGSMAIFIEVIVQVKILSFSEILENHCKELHVRNMPLDQNKKVC